MVSGSIDGTVVVWNLNEFKEIQRIKEQSNMMALASNDNFILSGSYNYIGIWSMQNYSKVHEFYHNVSAISILKTN